METQLDPAPLPEVSGLSATNGDESGAQHGLIAAARQPPVRLYEPLAVAMFVALADLTLYRGEGFAGLALFFLAGAAFLFVGTPRLAPRASCWIIAGMLLLLAARLVWLGSGLGVVCGVALLIALTMAAQGRPPYVLDLFACAAQSLPAGARGIAHYRQSFTRFGPTVQRRNWLAVGLPVAAVALFGGLFVLANPDLVSTVVEFAQHVSRQLLRWSERWDFYEALFWVAIATTAIGLIRPTAYRSALSENDPDREPIRPPAEVWWYSSVRNTLLAVIGLFAVYLVFEFSTLWFREFPAGFYYAGYAHQGAAWLTVALALATFVLALIFRGSLLDDPRAPRLRRLAWVWSAQNFLLALMVFNRMFIYIDFNGMTRMRVIGLFGMSAVVVGFALVIAKLLQRRSFAWLIRAQLLTLALTVYLFAITPVDLLAHRYNVRQIFHGDLAPAVQISVHPIDSEGVLILPALLEHDDLILREGIKAMLAERWIGLAEPRYRANRRGWTAYQLADERLKKALSASREQWKQYLDPTKRSEALERFHDYAYQWY